MPCWTWPCMASRAPTERSEFLLPLPEVPHAGSDQRFGGLGPVTLTAEHMHSGRETMDTTTQAKGMRSSCANARASEASAGLAPGIPAPEGPRHASEATPGSAHMGPPGCGAAGDLAGDAFLQVLAGSRQHRQAIPRQSRGHGGLRRKSTGSSVRCARRSKCPPSSRAMCNCPP